MVLPPDERDRLNSMCSNCAYNYDPYLDSGTLDPDPKQDWQ